MGENHGGRTPDTPDRLAKALADRYTLQRELGRGGMATVYLATDRKHERSVALKVLRPELAAALGPDRFLHEIKTTAQLAHPHILPLLDSGDAGGTLFYVMPYVEGESLRDRLTRERQLPVPDALQISREVADALAYAHSHGVVHRDIKPENILFQSGHAVVADFGIARAIQAAGTDRLTGTGLAIGTPAYMSPEQAAGDEHLDGRSDLYSLGCVLYEMLSGETPFTGSTPQAILAKKLSEPLPRISVVRDTVPAGIEAALNRAMARTAADRFATAGEFAAAITGPGMRDAAPPARPWRRRRTAVIATLVIVVLGVAGGLRLLSSSGIDFAARDWIVVTAFDNRTGDSVFEGSLGAALTVGLQQSRYVNVLPRTRVAEILGQMERPDTTELDEATGREVALRANVRVLVIPAISRIDSTYLLTTRIVDPQTGAELRARSARAQGKGEVLTALDQLVRRLRRDLGESRRALARNDVHLDQATTPSLEALRTWTEGNRAWNHRRLDAAAERYRAALRIDSSFAMAHKSLGEYFAWTAQRDSSEYYFARALGELDRVTERERLLIQAAFYGARANWDATLQTQETYVERYPDDLGQRYNLGSAYMRAGRHEDAVRVLRQVVEADSTFVSAWINLATTSSLMGADSAALAQYRRAFVLRPDYRLSGNLNHEFGFTFVQMGELDSAEATFAAMLSESPEQQASGHRSLGLLRMYQGRYAEARPQFERAIVLNRSLHQTVSVFRNRLYLAAAYGQTAEPGAFRSALRDAAAAADTVFLAPLWLARLAEGYARLGDTTALDRLAALIEQRATEGSTVDQAAIAAGKALVALARGDARDAAPLLQQAVLVAGDDGDGYRSLLARAYRLNGRPAQAESTYLALLGTKRALGWEAQEGWILAHYELAKIYQERGDTADAVDYFDRFLTLWQDGDPDLVPLADARARLGALRGPD